MNKSHSIKLYPTKSQEVFFKKSCGVARFAFNWALNEWKKDYQNGISDTAYSLIKRLNSIKKTEFPWMQETGKCASQYAIHNLYDAFKRMWKSGHKYPKFKKKGCRDSFMAIENRLSFKESKNKIWIPRLGWVRCSENVRFDGEVNYVTVKNIANMWFAIVTININKTPIDIPVVGEKQAVIGIDMGVKSMMVLSDGTVFENPKALGKNLKSIKRLHRGLSRKKIGGANRAKQRKRLSKKYYRITCIRKNAIHQATSFIVKKYDKIIIETLKPQSMLKNKLFSRLIMDSSFGEIKRQFIYKSAWFGKELIMADQWYPSSKLCSSCGNKKDVLKLSERTYKCFSCGLSIDRDLNASKNLAKYSPTLKYKGSEACGVSNNIHRLSMDDTMKQEVIELDNKNGDFAKQIFKKL